MKKLDMFDIVSYDDKDIKKIIDNLKWEIASPSNVEKSFISLCYTPIQYFGATDYRDHRKDTLEQLKALIMPNLKGIHQRLHFYKDREKKIPHTVIIVRGELGGYTGWFKKETIKKGIKK